MSKIILYKNLSDNNVVNKTLQVVKELTGTVRSSLDAFNPSIQIEYEGAIDANYLYIDDLKKYYYIKGVSYDYKNITTISCSEDVLMTFRDDIKKQKAIIERNSNLFNMYIQDAMRKMQQNTATYIKQFPNAFGVPEYGQPININQSWTYMLTVNGSYENLVDDGDKTPIGT